MEGQGWASLYDLDEGGTRLSADSKTPWRHTTRRTVDVKRGVVSGASSLAVDKKRASIEGDGPLATYHRRLTLHFQPVRCFSPSAAGTLGPTRLGPGTNWHLNQG